MKMMFGLLLTLSLSSAVSAQDFFLKANATTAEKVKIEIETNEAGDFKFSDPNELKRFLQNDRSIPDGWIPKREPSDVETVVDGAFMILTGLFVMGTHESHDINSELRLSTHSGLIFFVFPFEHHYLYAHCGGDHHLLATSMRPSEDTLKRMKTLNELKEICKEDKKES